MVRPIKEIYESSEQFWYPKLQEMVGTILKDPSAPINIDWNSLYQEREGSLIDWVLCIAYKAFDHLKRAFSPEYVKKVEECIDRLCQSIEIKTSKPKENPDVENVVVRVDEVAKEKLAIQEAPQQVEELSIDAIKEEIYRKYQPDIQDITKKITKHLKAIEFLEQYQTCQETIIELNQKLLERSLFSKSFDWFRSYKECDEDAQKRKNVLDQISLLKEQLENSPVISALLKAKLAFSPESLQTDIECEMKIQESDFKDSKTELERYRQQRAQEIHEYRLKQNK